ncbi:MAG: Trk K+ transport system NAD-binding subunit [Candidatus Azotimanducaceae bacterium]|jgi:Trk K+ transport system NAD-binding subunit
MRAPLLLLSAVYAVATLGLTLIPGLDDQGNPWRMDFFHAFYFVTFMGTTIGFGEIPYPFTDTQRMWTLIFIYITVATWIYAVGTLISLLQNEALKKALLDYQFRHRIKKLNEPFILIAGYGDTGTKLVRSLRRRFIQASIIDIEQRSIDALLLDDFPMDVPGILADASNPDKLVMAGINSPYCRAVVALTDSNAVNLHIAITAKVMNPGLNVICRSDSRSIEDNMKSFGTDHIIDPYQTFARQLVLATKSPNQYALNEWFRSALDEPVPTQLEISQGRWIICGFGKFGRAIYEEMVNHGLETQIIEPDASIAGMPENTIIGDGTGVKSLTEAGITNAIGIIAGSDDDSNNLSIIVTARLLNPELFVIIRQNQSSNGDLFQQSKANIVMESSNVIAKKIRTLLTNPMIDEFLSLARAHDDTWAGILVDKLRTMCPEVVPNVWAVTIGHRDAHAVMKTIGRNEEVLIQNLTQDHTDRTERLPLIVLYHRNKNGAFCMPDPSTKIRIGDKLLFAGTALARFNVQWNLQNIVALSYIRTGESETQTWFGRKFLQRRA